jgi:outer membrane receptor for ferrienterochelin and colicin
MRMPGLEGESIGGDTRYIRIRGMSHQLNTITMDGNRMADAGSAGTTRESFGTQTQTVSPKENNGPSKGPIVITGGVYG